MNELDNNRRGQVIAALVEGASVNSVVRMTGVSKPIIMKLLADLGTACAKYLVGKLYQYQKSFFVYFLRPNII
jgi:hypothetical protein